MKGAVPAATVLCAAAVGELSAVTLSHTVEGTHSLLAAPAVVRS